MTSSRHHKRHHFSSDLLPSFVCPWTESKSEKKFLVPVEKKIEKTEERSKSALPAPEEILLVRQRSSFFNDDQNGVNWNNDSLVSDAPVSTYEFKHFISVEGGAKTAYARSCWCVESVENSIGSRKYKSWWFWSDLFPRWTKSVFNERKNETTR